VAKGAEAGGFAEKRKAALARLAAELANRDDDAADVSAKARRIDQDPKHAASQLRHWLRKKG